MATFKDAKITAGQPATTSAQAGQVVVNEGTYEVTTALADNDVVSLVKWPAQHELVDVILESDDLDTNGTPAIVIDVGVANAAQDDLESGQNVITSSTVAQAGGVARAAVVAGLQLAASDSDRILAVKVTTVAATPAGGTLRMRGLFKPA